MFDSVRTCIFDAYGTLLDVNSAVSRNAASVGDVADALSALWRQRQLEYTWTRSLMKRYADFWVITEEALDYAMETFSLHEKPDLKQALLKSYLELGAYPDALGALEQIKTLGYRTAVLSNGTLHMVLQAMQVDDLLRHIDLCLTVDEMKIYKPDPAVYHYACERLGVAPGAGLLPYIECLGFSWRRFRRFSCGARESAESTEGIQICGSGRRDSFPVGVARFTAEGQIGHVSAAIVTPSYLITYVSSRTASSRAVTA